MGRLDGKLALVTGGGRGIGRGISERLAADGALVAVHYGSGVEAAAETVAAIRSAGGDAFAFPGPLGGDRDVEVLFERLDAQLAERGRGTELDILVNNAGITADANLEAATPETFDRLVAVNVRAPLFIAQVAATRMPSGGRIINMSSGIPQSAWPGVLMYVMTKAALNVMTTTLAHELGPRGVTVNTVAPGLVDTDMVAGLLNASDEARAAMAEFSVFNRIGEPAEVGNAIAFLVSDDARWVTGQYLGVGGSLL